MVLPEIELTSPFQKSTKVELLDRLVSSNAEICGCFSDLNGIGLSLKKKIKVKSIAHAFKYLSIYLLLPTRSVWNIIVPEGYSFEIYKKNQDYTDTFVKTMPKLK